MNMGDFDFIYFFNNRKTLFNRIACGMWNANHVESVLHVIDSWKWCLESLDSKLKIIYIYNNKWSREKPKLEFLIRVLILCHVSRFVLPIFQFKYEIRVQFCSMFTMLVFKYLCKCVINIENQKNHINYNHFYLTFFRPMKCINFGKEVAHGGKEVYNSYFLFQRRRISKGCSLITVIFSLWIRIALICN